MKIGKYSNGVEYVNLDFGGIKENIEALGKILKSKKIKSGGISVNNGAEPDMRDSTFYKSADEYLRDVDELLTNDMVNAYARFVFNEVEYEVYYTIPSGHVVMGESKSSGFLSANDIVKILKEVGLK